MTRTTRSTYAHSILALAAATASTAGAAPVAADEKRSRVTAQAKDRKKIDAVRARKAIEKKVRTGKVRRMLNRAADPEAGARRDAARKEQKRMAKQGMAIVAAPPRSPVRKSVTAFATVSPGGKHWEVSVAPA